MREAIAKGHILEALKEVEAEATAEEKANRWDRVAVMYIEASSCG